MSEALHHAYAEHIQLDTLDDASTYIEHVLRFTEDGKRILPKRLLRRAVDLWGAILYGVRVSEGGTRRKINSCRHRPQSILFLSICGCTLEL